MLNERTKEGQEDGQLDGCRNLYGNHLYVGVNEQRKELKEKPRKKGYRNESLVKERGKRNKEGKEIAMIARDVSEGPRDCQPAV